MPVDALAFNYRIVMYNPPEDEGQGFSQIGIVASEDSTTVTVTFPQMPEIQAVFGDSLVVTLNINQAYVIIERTGADLSGQCT